MPTIWLVAKLPITFKNSRSTERVHNLKRIRWLWSVSVSITPCYRQLMRSRKMETAVLPERQGYEPPITKEVLLTLSQEDLRGRTPKFRAFAWTKPTNAIF